MLNRRNFLTAAVGVAAATSLAACAKKDETGSTGTGGGDGKIVLGFSQVGSESGWRTANTDSVKEAAKAAGNDLKFSDAQQKQENQISAIRNYITQKVDVIAFSPVVVTGWDAVLKEAKAAKIPVVLTDRAVGLDGTSLYVTLVGSDFVNEGSRAGEWLVKEYKPARTARSRSSSWRAPPVPPPRSSAQKGFEEVMDADAGRWKIIASQTGDFTRAGGKAGHGGLPAGQPGDRRAVRAQRRHGPRRHPGDRGGRQEARQGHQDRHGRRREGRHSWRWPRARSTPSSSATRCSAPS